jgi:hypothetical protein
VGISSKNVLALCLLYPSYALPFPPPLSSHFMSGTHLVHSLVLVNLFFFFISFLGRSGCYSGKRRTFSGNFPPRKPPASGWAALGLSYKVQWPLHILFTPAVLEK